MTTNKMPTNKVPPRWFSPINRKNIYQILAQGLITSPSGFRKDGYVQDVLKDYDGWLPLFKNNVPQKNITNSTSDLPDCLLELELTGIAGQVKILTNSGHQERSLDSLDNDTKSILIPLPLPLTCIKKIIFQESAVMEDFKKDTDNSTSPFLTGLKLQSPRGYAKIFQETKNIPPQLVGLDNQETSNGDKFSPVPLPKQPDYSLVYAYGGMLSLLFYFAKNGKKSHDFFEQFIHKDPSEGDSNSAIPNLVHAFFYHDMDESKLEKKIITGILDCCLKSTDFKNFKNSIIDFLEDENWGKELAARKKELANTLRDYEAPILRSVSVFFNNAQSDIERLLLMLFLREDSQSFIGDKNDNIKISEDEYILYALFFGVRDGFIKTPPMLRKYQGLQAYISYKMADYAHKKMNSGISFKTMQPPTTVWQFVDKNISKQTVKELKIQSCVKTVMPKLDFTHKNGKNVYDGYVEAKHEIDTTKYFETISTTIIDDTIYNKLK